MTVSKVRICSILDGVSKSLYFAYENPSREMNSSAFYDDYIKVEDLMVAMKCKRTWLKGPGYEKRGRKR